METEILNVYKELERDKLQRGFLENPAIHGAVKLPKLWKKCQLGPLDIKALELYIGLGSLNNPIAEAFTRCGATTAAAVYNYLTKREWMGQEDLYESIMDQEFQERIRTGNIGPLILIVPALFDCGHVVDGNHRVLCAMELINNDVEIKLPALVGKIPPLEWLMANTYLLVKHLKRGCSPHDLFNLYFLRTKKGWKEIVESRKGRF